MSRLALAALLAALFATGCESSGGSYGSSSVGVSYYSGSRWHDPYYRRRCCYSSARPVPRHLPARARPRYRR